MIVSASLVKIAKARSRAGRISGAVGGALVGGLVGPGAVDVATSEAMAPYASHLLEGYRAAHPTLSNFLPSSVSSAETLQAISSRDLLKSQLPEEYRKYVPMYNAARVLLPAALGAGAGYAAGSLIDR